MHINHKIGEHLALIALATVVAYSSAMAQTVKIGVINSHTGVFAALGLQMDEGISLYVKEHEKDLPPGVKVELLREDDEGNPARAEAAANKLISVDHVQILTGILTPTIAEAIAPISVATKTPVVIMNASAPNLTARSPYFVSVAVTLAQEAAPLGKWVAYKGFKNPYPIASDYAEGRIAAQAFSKAFEEAGGKIHNLLFVPLATSDFSGFLQAVRVAKPDIAFTSLPPPSNSTNMTAQFLNVWRQSGLSEVSLAMMPNMLPDNLLPELGDKAVGIYSSGSYSAAATRDANRAFVAAFQREFGNDATPTTVSVQAWDGMAAIYKVIEQTKGQFGSDQAMSVLAQWRNYDSPRGLVMVDPRTRSLVATIYIRQVEKLGNRLQNVEIEQFAIVASDGTWGGGGLAPETILPSRIFAGPGQYPPRQFKAYGIVAFKTRPTAVDRPRYDMICDAYVSGLLHYTSVKAPLQQQMVTVWPVDTPALANKINREARDKVCADAVPNYGLVLAQEAIEAAKRSKAPLDGDGPFLLAWSPGVKQGQADALVLVSDMTDVINNEQAKQIFTRWTLDIQENSALWNNGWDEEKLKLVIRLWVDKWGARILQAINLKG